MNDAQFSRDYLSQLAELIPQLDSERITEAIGWLRQTGKDGRCTFVCGNGGSATIATEFVAEVVKGASYGRPIRYRMLSLTDNLATITAYANDVGYDAIFVEPLRNFAEPGDVLLAISGSGQSPNVLRAVEYANQVGCKTIGLTSALQGQLREFVDLPLLVPETHQGRLEDCFFILTHILSYALIAA